MRRSHVRADMGNVPRRRLQTSLAGELCHLESGTLQPKPCGAQRPGIRLHLAEEFTCTLHIGWPMVDLRAREALARLPMLN